MTITLRPYQVEPAAAILRDIRTNDGAGSTFTVLMSRQAGKNELSAWLEKVLLVARQRAGGVGVKCAPTLRPQLLNSIRRLKDRLDDAGLRGRYTTEEGSAVSLGRARWQFLSAAPTAQVVGATASLLLEADEAQDIEAEKFNKDFRPMAASTAATTVLYGTAWSEADLLWATVQDNIAREARDGIRRHFAYDWQAVAAHNPAYAAYVEAERQRLGANHPLFTTQYDLRPLPGAGRLLSPAQRLSIEGGTHDREHHPTPRGLYAAGLDIAGEETDPLSGRDRDHTVLTIARVEPPERHEKHLLPRVHVVEAYDWQGTGHDALYGQIAQLLGRTFWHVNKVAVDATAAGEAAAILLARALGDDRVIAYRYTQQSKSHLGYQLQAAANTGRLTLWQDDGSPERRWAVEQLRLCRAEYKPNRTVAWAVDAADGHDDHVNALALTVEAARHVQRREARGRIPRKERL